MSENGQSGPREPAAPSSSPAPDEGALYQALFESASDAIFLLREDAFVDCNPRTTEIFGYARSELLGQPPYAFSPPVQPDGESSEAKARSRIAAASAGQPQRFDWRHLRKDGSALDAEVSLSRVRIEDEDLVLAIVRDVTAQRQTEEALRASRAALRSLAMKITQVEDVQRMHIAQGLHDMVAQNLAAAILLLRQVTAGPLDGEARKTLDEVIVLVDQTAEQLRSLSFQLSPPSLTQLGLEAALEDLAERFERRYAVRFRVEDDGRAKPLRVEVRSILYRCVAELMTNAAHHAKAAEVTIFIRHTGDRLRVVVEDDGVGFDATDAGNGIHGYGGFGLFSVRERLRALGGDLSLESIPGDGTRAVLEVPLGDPAQAEVDR